jgi:hypothetical protein
MTPLPLPELTIDPSVRRGIAESAQAWSSIEAAEQNLLGGILPSFLRESAWEAFSRGAAALIRDRGYAIARGLDADDGRSLLVVSTIIGDGFETYAPGRIVKRFRMSPWTRSLSHTIAAGNFHTDGNVSPTPPAGTAMQCERDDPGGDGYAELRVASLAALLQQLALGGEDGREALAFLRDERVAMAHERSPAQWSGRAIEGGRIRYHPESLRVAHARAGASPDRLERVIATVHKAALAASIPFRTRPGDVLLVSNRNALHYRGECSVRFTQFPTEFESRSLLVLHRTGPDD